MSSESWCVPFKGSVVTLAIQQRRLSACDRPDRRTRREIPAGRSLGQRTGRSVVAAQVAEVYGGILARLEGADDHVHRVVRIRHHVRGESSVGILLLESPLEPDVLQVAVGVPGAFEQRRIVAE